MDTASLTISRAQALLHSGELTADGLTATYLQAIERLNPVINAFITLILPTVEPVAGRNRALTGIPLAIKDLYETKDVRTTAGTTFFSDYVPEHDAFAITRLRDSGAILLGKTNTHEIALGVTGVNPHYGAVRNPWDPSRITGGSSSGSAAAVVAGMCLGALGTDTGGSIRIPSALCGAVGLKPTFGRVSLRGVFPLSWNLDHAGPITKTVRDAAILLQAIAGFDPLDPACMDVPVDDYLSTIERGVKGWRVAVASGDYFEAVDDEVLRAYAEAAKIFSDLGAFVTPVEMSFLREAALANGQMVVADAAAYHRERLAEQPDGFGEDVRQRLTMGRDLSSSDYARHRRTQSEMRRRMELFFADYDLLLTPSVPIPAPPIEGDNAVEQAKRLTRFTAPFNLTGLPALSLPCGFSAEGLPLGLQIVAAPWGEGRVLRAGHAFEQATNWHKRRPSLSL